MYMGLKKATVMATVIAVIIAVGAGYVISAYAQDSNNNTTTNIQSVTPGMPWTPHKHKGFENKEFEKRFRGVLRIPAIEVSSEYNSTVMSVLESNSETSQLLSQGFSLKVVNPLIRAYVDANGEVILRATQSIAVLTNGTAVYTYLVDISGNTVKLISYHLVGTPQCECVCESTNK